MPLKSSIFLIAALILLPEAWAQKRPTIGLALEGGGALGLAHVGLLEWLADHHIPVDYIAGTSMGGVVGGLYASGMTPADLHRLVDTLDWNSLVNGQSNDRTRSFRRKEDIRQLGDQTMLGLRHGLIFPAGLNSGQQLDFLLSDFAAPYDQLRSFNDLPTPFRCVATDLVSKQAHVFDKGSLAEALRATVSVPGLFEPVTDGQHAYVDGGLLDNLPVDLVKAMGADIVIAVYLSTDSYDPKKPHTLVDVLGASLSVVIAAQERRNIEQADLLVAMDMSGLNESDYPQYAEMIRRGVAGAEKKSVVLSKFALNDADWAAYLGQREARRKTDVVTPGFVEVTGVDAKLAAEIREYFVEDIGQPFSSAKVRSQIQQVAGSEAFSYVAYDITQRDGKSGLSIYVHPSPSKPPTLQPALLIDGSDFRNPLFAIAGRLTFTDFGGFRSELRNTFVFGSTYAAGSEYFHPFTPFSPWFVAPRVFAENRPLDVYHRSHILALDRETKAGAGIDVGFETGNTGEFRLGYESSHMDTSFRLGGGSILPIVSGRYGAGRVSYAFDDADDEVIPTRGVLGHANLRWIDANPGANHGFPALDGLASFFHPLTAASSVFAGVSGGTTFGRANGGLTLFYLGGPQRLSAYGWNELYGNEFVLGRIGYLKQVAVLSRFTNNKAYLLIDYEVGRMYGFADATRAPMDANGGILVKTLPGPLFVGGSVGDSGHRKWYFQFAPFF